MAGIIQIIFQIVFSIIRWCISAISGLVRMIFSLLGKGYTVGKQKQQQRSVYKLRDTISDAYNQNHAMLEMANTVLAQLPDEAEATDKETVNRFQSYCQNKDNILGLAMKNITNDFATGTVSDVNLMTMKYSSVVQEINNMKHDLSKPELLSMIEKYSTDAYFVNTLLKFSQVENISQNGDTWTYTMYSFKFILTLEESKHRIIIVGIPNDAITFEDKRTRVCQAPKPNISHAQFYFNEKHQLEYTLVRNVKDITHYDVYEYFETIHRLMKKKTINEFAGKKILTRSDAEMIEDNMPDIFQNNLMKQVAPPPIEYLSDSEKMPNGKGRWAQLPDLKKNGMLSPQGFLIGKAGYGTFIYTGDYSGHILTIASTRSGKGVGVVIPNLLRHKGSSVILDPKGENFIVTAQHRNRLGNKVYYFDPWGVLNNYKGVNLAGTIKATINPLDFLDIEDSNYIQSLDGLASSLIEQSAKSDDKFFTSGSKTLLAQMITLVCERFPKGSHARNLLTVRNFLNKDPQDTLAQALDLLNDNRRTRPPHRLILDLASWLKTNIDGKTQVLPNTYDYAKQATAFLNDQNVSNSIMSSSVDLLKLKEEPISLYLILDLNSLVFNADLYKPLIRIILQSTMIGAGVRKLPKDNVLFMLDEIAQLGYLEYLPKMLSIFSGMGVTIWTIWQDLNQIKKIYEDDAGSMINNCSVQQYFGVNDYETAETVSKMAGKTTVYKETKSITRTDTGSTTTTEGNSSSSSRGTSNTRGTNTGHSYQGFNYTSSGGSNQSTSETETCTNSYNFSKSIQVGFSKSVGESVTQEVIDLITPREVMTTNAYDVQIVFYNSKIPYPILSGKIKYYSDREFLNEYDKNLTR